MYTPDKYDDPAGIPGGSPFFPPINIHPTQVTVVSERMVSRSANNSHMVLPHKHRPLFMTHTPLNASATLSCSLFQ